MRYLQSPVRKARHDIFKELTNLGFESNPENLVQMLEEIPYKVVEDLPVFRDSIYREREVARERVRLSLGMTLMPENRATNLTEGIEYSNVDEKYYEPPLMQVIPSACDICDEKKYTVTDRCRGCVAHPCHYVCPRDAITMVNGKSVIDQSKCIKCGKCKEACPYDAIAKQERPCVRACGVNAIKKDDKGRAWIDPDMCVSCGMCMVSCPFGAISDKSQVFQLSKAISSGQKVTAIVAPAFIGQFGKKVGKVELRQALLDLGFYDMAEVAYGADVGAVAEATHYAEAVETGELPFLLTSCCPSWAMLAKIYFPTMIDNISRELTPMVATARRVKKENPDTRVVFVGPCAAKKLEASRRSVRSDVDFVITFEELQAMFDARGVELMEGEDLTELDTLDDRSEVFNVENSGAGRGYAVAGGVAKAIEECLNEYYPEATVNIHHAEGLADCKKILQLAKAGKLTHCLIEGMGCPGGCVAGAGTNIQPEDAMKILASYVKKTKKQVPPLEYKEIHLE